ncbi:hypothetical protein [Bittarella massiliensis (ex Durand et al. 2017)]|uniref:hypothetical protein n=1 Tax=Bittarella massiliensis (ex Durand et al. 2017) TaxID=1720313 RepID=UPI001AA110D3|nr:hypothetical protein [Bittarella massiliensis (ex Durand et al. 2017)]MBO1679196.1 hypothetical protein [Bittarella massiliensis (ex Durand et al. 2017)]
MKRFFMRCRGWVALLLAFGCILALLFSDVRYVLFGAEGQFRKTVETKAPLFNRQIEGSQWAALSVWGLLDQENVLLAEHQGMQIAEMQGGIIAYDLMRKLDEGSRLQGEIIEFGGLPEEENLALQYCLQFRSVQTEQGFSILSPFPLDQIPAAYFSHTTGRVPRDFVPENRCIYFHVGEKTFLGTINTIDFYGDRLDDLTLTVEVEVFPQPTDFKELILNTGAEEIQVEFRNLYLCEYRVDGLLRRAMS